MLLQTAFMLLKRLLVLPLAILLIHSAAEAKPERGFVSLFDGKTLNGWQDLNKNGGYAVTNGAIACLKGLGGNLFTTNQYTNFILRFEFRLEPGSNNGIGIRAPIDGDAAYQGMELQVLDDTTKKYGELQPFQMHGSLYGVVPSKTGAQKPVGEWNAQEITADGKKIKVVLNGQTILDTDLSTITDPNILKQHPGILRDSGYIGFLGHGDYVEFRNIRIKELKPKKTK